MKTAKTLLIAVICLASLTMNGALRRENSIKEKFHKVIRGNKKEFDRFVSLFFSTSDTVVSSDIVVSKTTYDEIRELIYKKTKKELIEALGLVKQIGSRKKYKWTEDAIKTMHDDPMFRDLNKLFLVYRYLNRLFADKLTEISVQISKILSDKEKNLTGYDKYAKDHKKLLSTLKTMTEKEKIPAFANLREKHPIFFSKYEALLFSLLENVEKEKSAVSITITKKEVQKITSTPNFENIHW